MPQPSMSLMDLQNELERSMPAQAVAGPSTSWLSDVTLLAQRLADMPVAFVSVTDATTTTFLATQGATLAPAPRATTLCALVADRGGAVVIPDALAEPDLSRYPTVQSGLRAYIGVPMLDESGAGLDFALCVAADQPRADATDTVPLLEALARVAVRTLMR